MDSKMRFVLALGVVLAAQTCSADKILALVENLGIRETHSIFFKSLTERGHKVTFKAADDANIALMKFGESLYEHLIIFAPSAEAYGGISTEDITTFIDSGGNVLAAADSSIADALRDVAAECGVELDDQQTAVIDHINFDAQLDTGDHTTIVASAQRMLDSEQIVGGSRKSGAPILFRGVGLVTDKDNPLLLDVLGADSTAYSFDPDAPIDEYPHAVGRGVTLVAALQARNNARVVISGSLDMFSDQFIQANVNKFRGDGKSVPQSGNGAFIDSLAQWVFKERGVLRVKAVNHHLQGIDRIPPPSYTITQDVHYSIEIEELKSGSWLPFDGKDVQLEFVRIDPFVRMTLKNTKGKLTADFRLPDVYGVFKFVVDYDRVGFTHLYSSTQVSVRPLEHTQFERFIRSAMPYYASAGSMLVGLWLFALVFIHYKEPAATAAGAAQVKNK